MDKPASSPVETQCIASRYYLSKPDLGLGLLFDADGCMAGDAMHRVSTVEQSILPSLF